MTNREAQIFQWISENPMISQEELAARAGITRSSVAVHISNLMKKGYIQGKGYITGIPGYFAVLGAVNIDIGGCPDEPPIAGDSNPGSVTISFGGVGRNIAHNMRLLGLPVRFITAFGDDLYAANLCEHLNSLGIDISASLCEKNAPTSTYLFLTDEAGEMQAAVSDMRIYDYLTPEYLSGKLDILNHAQALLIDANLSEAAICYAAAHAEVPIFADPVSCRKAVRLLPVLSRLHTICPNRLEAEILSGCSITAPGDLYQAADALLGKGIQRIFITLGAEGVFCAEGSERLLLPTLASSVVNTTGAGDAFTASLAYSFSAGFSLKETALFGLAAASLAVESMETINQSLCPELVLARSGL